MEYVSCNLCKDSDTIELYHLRDLLLEQAMVSSILVRCQRCGLVYQNPRPSTNEISKYYPPEYDPFVSSSGQIGASWIKGKAIQYGIDKRCRIITKRKSGGKLLDVGCATGVFLQGMQRIPGWKVQGVEINSHAAQVAREQYDLDVFTGTLEEAEIPDQFYDVVTLWDVLEHMHDPTACLYEIHRILKLNGLLVIKIPNLNSWEVKLFGENWAGFDAPRHLYIFSEETISRMLAKTGFQIENTNCKLSAYPTFVLSVRFWLVSKKINPFVRQSITKILNHPLTQLLSSSIFYFSGLTKRGPQLTIVARRLTKPND